MRGEELSLRGGELSFWGGELSFWGGELSLRGKENKIPFLKAGDKYVNFLYKGYKFDLFIADNDNFGLTFLIRTGSAEFSTRMLAHWKKVTQGGASVNGYLHDKSGNKYLTPTEESVFELLKLDFINPEYRS